MARSALQLAVEAAHDVERFADDQQVIIFVDDNLMLAPADCELAKNVLKFEPEAVAGIYDINSNPPDIVADIEHLLKQVGVNGAPLYNIPSMKVNYHFEN
jgi:hypothetical protein